MAQHRPAPAADATGMRLDKWLWTARLFKTRPLAVEAIDKGRISVNGVVAKPSREIRVGDRLELRLPPAPRQLRICELCLQRRAASLAQAMYEESADSMALRQRALELARQGVEPARSLPQGRPTKRDRRELASWQRWSASADERDD